MRAAWWFVVACVGTAAFVEAAVRIATPLDVLVDLRRAYEDRSSAELATLLAADYRFDSVDSVWRARHPEGWGRDDEIAAAGRLFHGCIRDDGHELPAARRIAVRWGPVRVLGLGRTPDGAATCDLIVHDLAMDVDFGASTWLIGPTTHLFRLVRVATSRAGGVVGRRWLIRAWRELPDSSDTARVTPPAGAAADSTVAAAGAPESTAVARAVEPARLALQPVRSRLSASAALQVAYTLPVRAPARLELFDVTGRRLERAELPPDLGAHVATLATARRAPGAYWVRLSQGGLHVASKVVVLP